MLSRPKKRGRGAGEISRQQQMPHLDETGFKYRAFSRAEGEFGVRRLDAALKAQFRPRRASRACTLQSFAGAVQISQGFLSRPINPGMKINFGRLNRCGALLILPPSAAYRRTPRVAMAGINGRDTLLASHCIISSRFRQAGRYWRKRPCSYWHWSNWRP